MPPADMFKMKCFKYDKLEHTANNCYARNFQISQQGKLPPRVNTTEDLPSELTGDKHLRICCRLPGIVGMGNMLVDTGAGINKLKRGITKETANTESKEFLWETTDTLQTNDMISQIKYKTHISHVADNFSLIEDGIIIIGLPFLKKIQI